MQTDFRGKGTPLTKTGVQVVLDMLKIDAPTLWAVLATETAGVGFLSDRRPDILYERHIFSKLTKRVFDEAYPSLSNRSPGNYGMPGSNQYVRLHNAINLNRKAALQSCSWGIGQLMGFNAEMAGYDNVESMVDYMVASEDKQLLGMAGEIAKNDLQRALREKKWAKFAKGYNGVNYEINAYDTRLAAAYNRYRDFKPELRVRAVQMFLRYFGYNPGPVDGAWGSRTQLAAEAWSRKAGFKYVGLQDLFEELERRNNAV